MDMSEIYVRFFILVVASLLTLAPTLILFIKFYEEKRTILLYSGLLSGSLFLVSLQMHISFISQLLGISSAQPFQTILSLTLALGNTLSVICAPLFVFAFFEKMRSLAFNIVLGILGSLTVVTNLFHCTIFPSWHFFNQFCHPLIYLSILISAVTGWIFFRNEKSVQKKRTVLVLLMTALFFLPLLILDGYWDISREGIWRLLWSVRPIFFMVMSIGLLVLTAGANGLKAKNDTNLDEFVTSNKLTRRECDVLELLITGKKSREVAQVLSLKEKSVTNYINRIYRKCNVSSRVELLFEVHSGSELIKL